MNVAGTSPESSSGSTDNNTCSVSTPALASQGDLPYRPLPRRVATAPVLGQSLSQLERSLPIRSKTLGDAPNLNGKIRKVGPYSFAIGGFADIWLGELTSEPSDEKLHVAVKVLRSAWSDKAFALKLKSRLEREASVWMRLSHPCIMPFLGTCDDFDYSKFPSLVSPYFKNGNVNVFLEENAFEEDVALVKLRILSQTGDALCYLHANGVVHGDVKGSNIMIDDDGNAKLSDFGISRMLETTGFTTKTIAGTVRWMARELVFDEDESSEDVMPVTVKTDVWSYGMTILEVLTGKMPFSEFKHDAHVLLSVMRGKLPQRPNTDIITDDIWSYLTWCWHVNPEKRPSVQQITDFVKTSCGKRNGSYKGRTISYDQKSAEFSSPVNSFTYGPYNRILNGNGYG